MVFCRLELIVAYDGALYFVRDALLPEFHSELKLHSLQTKQLAPGIFFSEHNIWLYWVLDYWPVRKLYFSSISEAAKKLRMLNRYWAYAGGVSFRRGKLIAEALRIKPIGQQVFPAAPDEKRYYAFTLASPDTLLWSDKPLKGRFAGGRVRFAEDKSGPPSRAYLKLQEALLLTGFSFTPEDHVLDLGATPGGWSYVAAQSGAHVVMVDRSTPPDLLLKKFPQIEFMRGDGLKLPYALLQSATVLLSDMACEPAKLYKALETWLSLPRLRFMVCTLKFHGLSDKKKIDRFAHLPGARIYHLWHNGHELAWVWQRCGFP